MSTTKLFDRPMNHLNLLSHYLVSCMQVQETFCQSV